MDDCAPMRARSTWTRSYSWLDAANSARGRELHLNSVKVSREGQSGNQAILNRQNEMMKTPCLLFSFESRLPKLDVAGSIPVSRSIFSMTCTLAPIPNTI